MPINISKDALSAIKIGESDLVKAVVGINEIFPNDTQLTGFTFVSAATVPQAGANRTLTVSGDIGSSFTLTGTTGATGPSGTQTLAASPTNYTIPISANSVCGAGTRIPIITIAAQGNTVYGATFPRNPLGSPNYPDPILTTNVNQVAGPQIVSNVTTITMSSTGSGPTVNIGGQLRWAVGAVLTTTFSVTTNYTLGSISMSVDGDGGSYYSGQFFSIGNNGISPQAWNSSNAAQVNWTTGNSSLNGMNGSVTYTYNGYNGGGNAVAMRSTINIGGINCEVPTVTSASTIAYP